MSIKCLMNGLEVNYPCSPSCALFGDCVTAFESQKKANVRNNADRINAMTIEEKAEFLSGIAYGRKTPWSLPFAEKFCKNCPTTTCTIEGYHHPMELHECDLVDGKCPHGSAIVWWLQQPAGEEDRHEP